MILSDRTIREQIAAGRIVIDPFDAACVQPSSVDLHVDRQFRVFRNNRYGHIDVKQEMAELTELVEVAPEEPFMLHPGEFVLGSTLERVVVPDDLVDALVPEHEIRELGTGHAGVTRRREPGEVLDARGIRLPRVERRAGWRLVLPRGFGAAGNQEHAEQGDREA